MTRTAAAPGAKHTLRPVVLEIEVLRGVVICAVVAIHTSWYWGVRVGFETSPGRFLGALMLASSFGVPLFYALSALLLSLGEPITALSQFLSMLRRRATRLLPAYVTWSLVSLALLRPQALLSPRQLARVLLLGTADTQFYYIPLLFQLFLAWPLLQPLARWSAQSPAAAWAVAAGAAAVSLGWWVASAYQLVPAVLPDLFFYFAIYAGLGIASAPYLVRLKALLGRNKAVLALLALGALTNFYLIFSDTIRGYVDAGQVLFAAMILQPHAVAYIYLAIVAFAAFVFALRSPRASALLTWLAANSYGIFLVHIIVLTALTKALAPPVGTATDAGILMTVTAVGVGFVTLFGSALFVALLSRSRVLRPLVSNRF